MTDYPSFGDQAQNLINASGRIAKNISSGRGIFVSSDEIEERRKICGACEFLDIGSGRCKKCGCFIKAKTRLETEQCPIGKWGGNGMKEQTNQFKSTDIPKPPKNPNEGQIYIFKGKGWEFKNGEWMYITQSKLRSNQSS